MKEEIRMLIWDRDKGTCQKCKMKLINKVDYYEEALEGLHEIQEIPIYRWKQECWWCKKETDIVSYDFVFLHNHGIGDMKDIDEILIEKYPFVKKGPSKFQDKEVIANWCIHCGKLQGNYYMKEQILFKLNEEGPENLIDMKIPNTIKIENIPVEKSEEYIVNEKNTNFGNIHHIDRNRKNNNPNNLILLCRKCHIETHKEIRKKIVLIFKNQGIYKYNN